MAYVMKVGILKQKDKDGKVVKVYKPGDELASDFVKNNKKAIDSGVVAGSIVEKKKAAPTKSTGDK